MPCDSIILNSIEVGKMNAALLKRALTALGARNIYQYGDGETFFELDGADCTIRGGRMNLPKGSEHLADKVKRAYSVETVKYTAQRNGWTLTKKGEFVYEVTK